jgi:hypothetical protein
VQPKERLAFFRGYLEDLVVAVKQAAALGASLEEMKETIPGELAARYEAGMSKYPMGQFRERIALNIEATYAKVVRKG